MDEAGGQAPLRRLRQERNRFLAFAFAAADLLIEVDGEGRILYAAGSTRVLLGRGAEELVGKAFIDLTAAYDRAMFRQILRRLEGADRIAPVRLRLASPKGGAVPMLLSGYRLPDLADHRFLALSVMRQARSDDEGRDRASG
ncbi:MAG: PAS domain S-box protein, partial [Alphaproteobacteria bacterium]|nr:PAS domain S-box protein [Alphaproteobacteria bacterium]